MKYLFVLIYGEKFLVASTINDIDVEDHHSGRLEMQQYWTFLMSMA